MRGPQYRGFRVFFIIYIYFFLIFIFIFMGIPKKVTLILGNSNLGIGNEGMEKNMESTVMGYIWFRI